MKYKVKKRPTYDGKFSIIEPIKAYRDATGCSLKEAKDAIESGGELELKPCNLADFEAFGFVFEPPNNNDPFFRAYLGGLCSWPSDIKSMSDWEAYFRLLGVHDDQEGVVCRTPVEIQTLFAEATKDKTNQR